MSGTWVQKSTWGDLEEYWSSPQGESMVSSFRCSQEDLSIEFTDVIFQALACLWVIKNGLQSCADVLKNAVM